MKISRVSLPAADHSHHHYYHLPHQCHPLMKIAGFLAAAGRYHHIQGDFFSYASSSTLYPRQ